MKKIFIILILLFSIITIYSKDSNIRFYGQYESRFDFIHKTDYFNKEYQSFGWGWNNYANLRMKATINEYLTFDMAVNLNMLAGSYTDVYRSNFASMAQSISDPSVYTFNSDYLFSIPFYYESTYIGSFDMERLYFKAGNNFFDIEAGLIRIARGFGYSFSPTDFFNPANPLNPDARPKGKLAILTTFYPLDMWKIEAFAVAPDNPVTDKIWGFKFGTATKFSIDKFNFEFLYTLFFPEIEYLKDQEKLGEPSYKNNNYSHIIGFSMKADIEIGLFIDMTYRFDQMVFRNGNYYGKELYFYRGLESEIGIDYTINIPATDANIYLLLEYMFYGSGMLDWGEKDLDNIYTDEWKDKKPLERSAIIDSEKKPLNFLRHDYLSSMIKIKINTYISTGINYLFGIDDQSSLLTPFIEIEPFQAFTISVKAFYPLGWEIINNQWYRGEFGPTNVGYYQNYNITVKIKF